MAVRSTPFHPHDAVMPCTRLARFGRPAPAQCALLGLLLLCGCRPATEPKPPSGGQRYELPYAQFVSEVEPIFQRQGCSSEGDCHGGGVRGTFELSPESAPNPSFDFTQASLQVDGHAPEQSPLLLKPLALDAGGAPHSHKPFASLNDPDYQRLMQWVMAVRPVLSPASNGGRG